MNIQSTIKLSFKQQDLLNALFSKDLHTVVSSGVPNTGKSHLNLIYILFLATNYPNFNIGIGRAEVDAAMKTAGGDLKKILDDYGVAYNSGSEDNQLVIKDTKSRMFFFGLKETPQDPHLESLSSYNLHSGYVEEVTQVSQFAFEKIQTRIRHKDLTKYKLPGKRSASCNPSPKARWLKNRYVKDDKGVKVKAFREGETMIHFAGSDLPIIAERKRFFKRLESMEPKERDLFLNESWDFQQVEGVPAYPQFNYDTHITDLSGSFDYTLPIWASYDHNVLPYSSGILAQMNDNKREIRIFAELIGRPEWEQNNAEGLGELTADLLPGYKLALRMVGDSTSKRKSSGAKDDEGNKYNITKKVLDREGIKSLIQVLPKNPSVAQRIEFVNSILKGDLGYWRILIDQSCRELIQDITLLAKNANGGKIKDKRRSSEFGGEPVEHRGHLTDCLEYLLVKLFYKDFTQFIGRSGGADNRYQPVVFTAKPMANKFSF